jgi:hypothetical protein
MGIEDIDTAQMVDGTGSGIPVMDPGVPSNS